MIEALYESQVSVLRKKAKLPDFLSTYSYEQPHMSERC